MELSIINIIYETYKQITLLNDRLTKRWRYSLGLSLENSLLGSLENLIMAKHAPRAMKSAYLIKANSQLELVRLKLRLMLELGIANETKIFQIQAKLEEGGRMLGGWLKSVK